MQRELGRVAVLEVRYNGNRTVHQWMVFNYNEVNIFENGFLHELPKRTGEPGADGGKTFSDKWLRNKTPIIDAAFANSAANFASSQFINYLNNGQVGTFAQQLAGNNQNTPAYFCALVGSAFGPCKQQREFPGDGSGLSDQLLPV